METSSTKTPFLGWVSVPSSFVSLFIFYLLLYLLSKTMGCFPGRLMSSGSGQKLFCEVCSAFKCSFDELVGEKVVSPSHSSAILAPPLCHSYNAHFVCVCGGAHSQSCPTLCDPMDCRLPRSSVHAIFQAKILEWVAIYSSRGCS